MTFNALDFGAKVNCITDDAPAIQAAIDAGSKAGGGGAVRGRKAFLFRLHYLKGKRRAVSGTGGNSGDPETFLMCLFTQKMLTT